MGAGLFCRSHLAARNDKMRQTIAPTKIIVVIFGSAKLLGGGSECGAEIAASRRQGHFAASVGNRRAEKPADEEERGEIEHRGDNNEAAEDAEQRAKVERDEQHEKEQQRDVPNRGKRRRDTCGKCRCGAFHDHPDG